MRRALRFGIKSLRWLAAYGCLLNLNSVLALAQTPAPPGPAPIGQPQNPGVQQQQFPAAAGDQADTDRQFTDLMRGPVHQGYAEMVGLTPQPAPPVPSAPPQPIDEQAADVGPDNQDAEWLPGYWDWDKDQRGFIWVSGTWRVPPPGFRWVPGYWTTTESG